MIRQALSLILQEFTRRFSIVSLACLTVIVATLTNVSISVADDEDEVKLRELFVPRAELPLLLEHYPRRVFMTREQFEGLRLNSKVSVPLPIPRSVIASEGNFQIVLREGRAAIQSTLTLESLEDGVHAVPLVFGGMGMQKATLDSTSAAMARGDRGEVLLLVSGRGTHRFEATMTAPVSTSAAIQTLHLQFPETGSSTISLTVPGNVEILSGAVAIRREFVAEANETRFEVLPQRGPMSIVLSLNNRSIQDQKIVTANSLITSTLSASWETINAEVTFHVLHGTTDQFQIRLPKGFDVSDVRCESLARWSIDDELESRLLTIDLRRTMDRKEVQREVVHLTASRARREEELWSFPRIELLDVESNTTIAGVLLDDRLKLEAIQESGVIPIDGAVLENRIANWRATSGVAIRPKIVVAYYAPQDTFEIRSRLVQKPAEFRSTTNLVLVAKEHELELYTGIAILVVEEQLVQVELQVPPLWTVMSIESQDGKAVPWRESAVSGERRLRLTLPNAVRPGQTVNLIVKAKYVPPGWLGSWPSFSLEFPKLQVVSSSLDEGACAIAVHDDLSVRPEALVDLTILNDADKKKFRLEEIPTQFAYRFETSDWSALFTIERNQPVVTATTLGFYLIEPTGLTSKFELRLNVQQARIQEVHFSLPESTPSEVSIQGLDGIAVRETTSILSDDRRHWTIILAQKSMGSIKLSVEFVQPLSAQGHDRWNLPDLRIEDVLLQSGYYAVEGHSDLDVNVLEHPRMVDQGELVDSIYSIGRHQVGTYAFVGEPKPVVVQIADRQHAGLPMILVEKAILTTWLGVNGRAQTAINYKLRAKSPALHFELPNQAELWSVVLDNQPVVPQNDGGTLLIPLEANSNQGTHELQIVYEVPIARLEYLARTTLVAPFLFVLDRRANQRMEVPTADVEWQIGLPYGYEIVSTQGSLYESSVYPWSQRWTDFGRWLLILGGYDENKTYLSTRVDSQAAFHDAEYRGLPKIAAPAPASSAVPMDSQPVPNAEIAQVETDSNAQGQLMEQEEFLGVVPQLSQPSNEPLARFGKEGYTNRKALNEGWKSLNIDVEQPANTLIFQSFGARPLLEFQIAQQNRWSWLVYAIGAMLLTRSFYLWNRDAKKKLRWLLVLVIVGCLSPLVLPWTETARMLAEVVVLVAIISLGIFLLGFLLGSAAKGFRSLASRLGIRWLRRAVVSVICASLVYESYCSPARAQSSSSGEAAKLIELLKAAAPIQVPDDAIIIPYDPDSSDGWSNGQEILVPLETYEKLRKQVEAAQQPTEQQPPRDWAWKGIRYESSLQEGDRFMMRGRMELEVFGDAIVTVPFPVLGGVLASVTMDGQPAKLTVVTADRAVEIEAEHRALAKRPVPNQASSLFLLQAEGRGSKSVEVTIQFGVERQGGWRIVSGLLPTGQANQWDIQIPLAGTELKLAGVVDRTEFRSQADETIFSTSIARDGSFGIQWRPRISEASVDQGLSAESQATINIREDAIRMSWKTNLTFRRGRRESLTFEIPTNYFVEEVLGSNVRGWTIRDSEEKRFVDVELLGTAQDSESLEMRISHRRNFKAETEQIDVPWVRVPDSMLQQGTLTIRRSRWIDLRSEHHEFISRMDLIANEGDIESVDRFAPVDLIPFQSFRFLAVPFRLTVTASPVSPQAEVNWQGLLKIAPRELILEAKFQYSANARPIHRIRLAFPRMFELQPPMVPCNYDWYIDESGDEQIVHILPERGLSGSFDIVVLGTRKRELVDGQISAQFLVPSFRAVDVAKQAGTLVLQADPSFNVRLEQLDHAELLGPNAADAWMQSEQKSLVRAVLSIRGDRFSGLATTIKKSPVIQARSISNIRVTEKAIEETILLDWTIREASVQSFSFVLPYWMRDARVSAPWLRQLQRRLSAEQADAPVRFTIDLQDDVIGEFRVKIENDRSLDSSIREAPIPTIETGQAMKRFVLLENAGRDELIIGESRGVEAIHAQSSEWNELTNILGAKSAQAFSVRNQAESPILRFSLDERAAIQTVSARIGLFLTVLALDRSGTYRASAELRVENRNEPFVEIELPTGASVWTATVAGEPMKPMLSNQPQRLRIPLIKTPVGSLDYPVIIKYGGQIAMPTVMGRWSIPFIRVANIRPEQSQVRLFLPDEQHWFDFSGTLGRINTQSEWDAGLLSFKQKQVDELRRVIESKAQSKFDSFSQSRAKANLRQLGTAPYAVYGANVIPNDRVLDIDQDASTWQKETEDNRTLLSRSYAAQSLKGGTNSVMTYGNNFFHETEPLSVDERAPQSIKDAEPPMNRGNATDEVQHAPETSPLGGNPQVAQRPGSTVLRIESIDKLEADKKQMAKGEEIEEKLKQYEAQLQSNAPNAMGGIDGQGRFNRSNRVSELAGSEPNAGYELRRFRESESLDSNVPSASPLAIEDGDRRDLGRGLPQMEQTQRSGQAVERGALQTFEADRPTYPRPENAADVLQPSFVGFVSLDLPFPTRGVEYMFSTPGGDLELSGRTISKQATTRGVAILALAASVVVIWFGWRMIHALWSTRRGRLLVAAIAFMSATICFLAGLPVYGILLVLTGLVGLFPLEWSRQSQTSA